MIAAGACLTDILENLCRAIDAQDPDVILSVLLMDPDGKRLWPTAGQRVPEEWRSAITPIPIGPRMGSCGTAAFRKERVINSDIATDPLWSGSPAAEYRAIALRNGLRATWSRSPKKSHPRKCSGGGNGASNAIVNRRVFCRQALVCLPAIRGDIRWHCGSCVIGAKTRIEVLGQHPVNLVTRRISFGGGSPMEPSRSWNCGSPCTVSILGSMWR